jgi:hypothetical protein
MGGALIPRAMQFEHLHELQNACARRLHSFTSLLISVPLRRPQKLSRFLCGRFWTASLAGCQRGTGHQFIACPGRHTEAGRQGALERVRKRNVGVSNFDVCGCKRRPMGTTCSKGQYQSFPIGSIVTDGNLNLFCTPVASFSRQLSQAGRAS